MNYYAHLLRRSANAVFAISKATLVSVVILAFTVAAPAQAADANRGKTLHDAHCTACHISMTGGDGSVLYTRKNRRVKTFEGLQNQVRWCETNLELKWFEEDIADVVEYLNTKYYSFTSN